MPVITEYIKYLQSYEEYAFSWEELLQYCGAPESTLRKELGRLAGKQEILNLRQGFYLILPPRYHNLGKLPVELYVDKLFRYLEKTYYVAFYSAAAFHGASHQQIQQDYIVTAPPALRDISKKNQKIRFFKTTHWPQKNLEQKKSDAGLFYVSSPALTAIDLIHHQSSLGGLNRMLANLEELVEALNPVDLRDLLSWYPYKSSLQRLGYLLDELGATGELTTPILGHLKKENFYPVMLRPTSDQKAGSAGNRWKIDVNLELESDI